MRCGNQMVVCSVTSFSTNQHRELLRFPALMQRARARSGLAQKAVALILDMDQAQVCGVEKGRRQPFDDAMIRRLSQILGLEKSALDDLLWAARHDRSVRSLSEAAHPIEHIRLVSDLLAAARHLGEPERSGLSEYLRGLEVSASQIQALRLRTHPAAMAEGAAQMS